MLILITTLAHAEGRVSCANDWQYTPWGDVNLDGVVDDDDMTFLASIDPGTETEAWGDWLLGDMCYDGVVTALEVVLAVANMGNEYPPEYYIDVCASLNPIPIVGDLDGDGWVNMIDLLILLSNYGTFGSADEGDLDDNGIVNVTDITLLLSTFGTISLPPMCQ